MSKERPRTTSMIIEGAQEDVKKALEALDRAASSTLVSLSTLGSWVTGVLLSKDTHSVLLYSSTEKGALGVVKGSSRRLTYVGLEGSVLVWAGGVFSEVTPGRAFRIRPGEDHRIETEGPARILAVLTASRPFEDDEKDS